MNCVVQTGELCYTLRKLGAISDEDYCTPLTTSKCQSVSEGGVKGRATNVLNTLILIDSALIALWAGLIGLRPDLSLY